MANRLRSTWLDAVTCSSPPTADQIPHLEALCWPQHPSQKVLYTGNSLFKKSEDKWWDYSLTFPWNFERYFHGLKCLICFVSVSGEKQNSEDQTIVCLLIMFVYYCNVLLVIILVSTVPSPHWGLFQSTLRVQVMWAVTLSTPPGFISYDHVLRTWVSWVFPFGRLYIHSPHWQ